MNPKITDYQGRELASATWKDVEGSIKGGKLSKVILPVGSLEQHGPHLPLGTDSVIAEYVARGVHKKCDSAFLMPVVYIGCSGEHIGFPGTVSLQNETLSGVLFDISRSLVQSRLYRLFVINGHGGNRATLDATVRKIADAMPQMRLYSFTIADIVKQKFEEIRGSARRLVGHADEIETSMMLAIQPDFVKMSEAVKEEPSLPDVLSFEPDDLSKVSFGWHAKSLTKSGVIGDPLLAEARKGRILLDFAVDTISATINGL